MNDTSSYRYVVARRHGAETEYDCADPRDDTPAFSSLAWSIARRCGAVEGIEIIEWCAENLNRDEWVYSLELAERFV